MSLDFPAQNNPAQRPALQVSSLRDGADASGAPWICFCSYDCDEE